MTAFNWWLLRRITSRLALGELPAIIPATISRRALALLAMACTMVIIPVGAALGGAWNEIKSVIYP